MKPKLVSRTMRMLMQQRACKFDRWMTVPSPVVPYLQLKCICQLRIFWGYVFFAPQHDKFSEFIALKDLSNIKWCKCCAQHFQPWISWNPAHLQKQYVRVSRNCWLLSRIERILWHHMNNVLQLGFVVDVIHLKQRPSKLRQKMRRKTRTMSF